MADLEALRDREPWVHAVTPSMRSGLQFVVEVVITLHGEPLLLNLKYPGFFPDIPPTVVPSDRQRLSGHQYGGNGELCLEYRSDNWQPSITGAMMIESAYRLLSGERPTPDLEAIVPSAHQSSLGQRLRGSYGRFLLTAGLQKYSSTLSVGDFRPCRIVDIFGPRSSWISHVTSVGSLGTPEWCDESIPVQTKSNSDALLLRVAALDVSVIDAPTLDGLTEAARRSESLSGYNEATTQRTILTDGNTTALFVLFLDSGSLTSFHTIDLTAEPAGRLARQYVVLPQKKVGLIGCGSLGSKIATSLARSGIGSFVLVDDDIFKPGNLVRHDLDAGSLGLHKADALMSRVKAVSPQVEVDARRVILGGQEAAGTTSSILEEIASCDILIDATANPQAFNLIASVARTMKRPMIWGEVFAGGIGGFVARVRPDIEPTPHAARQQYIAWCEQEGVPWENSGGGYGDGGEATPMVADDAAVSVIAAHMTRMATDCLLQPDATAFPHPAYVIGLAHGWIFAEPFDVRPLDFVSEGPWQTNADPVTSDEIVDYILSLIKRPEDETRTGT